MSKTEELDQLFEQWVEEFPQYRGKFKKDGIIDEETFEAQEIKLLFITKEPNDPGQREGDYREWLKEVKHSFSHRICEWAFGVHEDFPPLNQLNCAKRKEIMKTIAFMNLKKIGGKAKANDREIQKVIENEKELLKGEIDIIKPTIMIGSVGRKSGYLNSLFNTDSFKDSGFDVEVGRFKTYKIINFYHPSYRVPRAMSYALLGAVVNSQIFRNL